MDSTNITALPTPNMNTSTQPNTFQDSPSSATWLPAPNDHKMDGSEPRLDTLVSDEVVWVVEIVVVTVLCGLVSVAGLVANGINILVFFRQGALSSSSNVSLLALAFADTGCLVPVLCNSISYAMHHLGLPNLFLTPRDFFDTLVVWPHIMCMQIASWITAYIAFERCLCVLIPLKVKFIFSARRSVIVTSSIAMTAIVSFIPTFVTQRIAFVLDPATNTSGVVAVMTDHHLEVIHVSDIIQSMTLRPLALFIVFTCTQITIYRVKLSSAWRKSFATASAPPAPSSPATITTTATTTTATTTPLLSKELRLVKMITMISTIFIICNAPDIIGVYALISQMATLGLTYADNVFFLLVSVLLCLESVNSSINIFVYYRMSSVYRQTFLTLIGRQ